MPDPAENALADARTIVRYLYERDLTPTQRDLLMCDYAARSLRLPRDRRAELDPQAVQSHLPRGMSRSMTSLGTTGQAARQHVDIAVLTVLPTEFFAVSDVLGLPERETAADEQRRRYFETRLFSPRLDRDLTAVVTMAEGAHDLRAAEAMQMLRLRYAPDLNVLVGIGAGHREVFRLGDVAVPQTVWNYEARRAEPRGPAPRPRSHPMPTPVAFNLNYYQPARTDFHADVREFFSRPHPAVELPPGFAPASFRPRVKSQGVATGVGATVIADDAMMDRLRTANQLSTVADQESYGFAEACRGSWWAVFRGISDHGSSDKGDDWHYVAAATAALCLKDFLRRVYLPAQDR